MRHILFIKTSSLGDVVHQFPVLTDARRHLADARLTWIVEEAFAPLAKLHPAANDVIPVAARRWRKHPFSADTWREMRAFRSAVNTQAYDAIVDTQGLIKTGVMARCARGVRHGYDAASMREWGASWLYDARHRVSRNLHAIERNRRLAGLALGYEPVGLPDYGLDPERFRDPAPSPYAVLLHATARPEKRWSEERWVELARALPARGLQPLLLWGNEVERDAAQRIAAAAPGTRVAEFSPLDAVARVIVGASLVVGVDTGLMQLAAALYVPLVAIFVATDVDLFGPVGQGRIEVVGAGKMNPTAAEVLAASERVLS
jgi:heptosyltransferase-1